MFTITLPATASSSPNQCKSHKSFFTVEGRGKMKLNELKVRYFVLGRQDFLQQAKQTRLCPDLLHEQNNKPLITPVFIIWNLKPRRQTQARVASTLCFHLGTLAF